MAKDSDEVLVRACQVQLQDAARELDERLSDVASMDPEAASQLQGQYSTALLEAGKLTSAMAFWLDAKPGVFKKRPSPRGLLDEGDALRHALVSARDHALSVAAIPNRIMADVASTVSRIAVSENQLGTIARAGGDTADGLEMIAQLRATAEGVRKLAEAGRYLEARTLSSHMAADAQSLSRVIREQQNLAAELPEVIVQARASARGINELASSASSAVTRGCPAAQLSLDELAEANSLFNSALSILEPLMAGVYPPGSTTAAARGERQLQAAHDLLVAVQVREDERNWAWESCLEVHEHIAEVVTELSRKRIRTELFWAELDSISALLSAGDVLEAAPRQAALLLDVSVAHRPALAAAVSEPLEKRQQTTAEAVTDWQAVLNAQQRVQDVVGELEAAAVTVGEASAPTDEQLALKEREDMAHLRNLVTAMASEVQALRQEVL